MSYPLFPTLPGLEYPVTRAPVAASLRQKAISGRRTQQPLWSAPLYKYEVSFSLLRQAQAWQEWQALLGFWNSVMFAPGGVFEFDDPNDNGVTAQAVAAGDGATTEFQLVRSLGGFTEPVLDPTIASLTVAGSGAAYTLGSYGVVTFASPPASGAAIAWSGSYTWLCTFDDDSLDLANFMDLFWELKKCSFTTWRP